MPATPALQQVRHNTTSIGVAKNILQSEELRSDRQLAGVRYGTRQAGGDIVMETTHGGAVHTLLEALLCGTWTANVLKAGVTRRSFSVVRNFGDLGAGNKAWHAFSGIEFGTLKLAMTTEGMVMMTASAMGKGNPTMGEVSPVGATFPAVTTGLGFDSFSGAILEGGASIAVVTELELTLENGLEPRFVIGSRDTLRPSIGRSLATGQITCHFESATMLDKFIGETNSSLDFTIGDGTNTLQFSLPNIKYTGGQPDVGGEGPIMLVMPFTAEYSVGSLSQIVVTRSGV
jgi:hypothetical protein